MHSSASFLLLPKKTVFWFFATSPEIWFEKNTFEGFYHFMRILGKLATFPPHETKLIFFKKNFFFKKPIFVRITKQEAQQSCDIFTVDKKWLDKEIHENFKQIIGTLKWEEARKKWYSQNLFHVSSGIFSAVFLKQSKTLDFNSNFKRKIISSLVKTAFYVSGGTFWVNRFFSKITQLTLAELADRSRKKSTYWGNYFPRVIFYDGK